MTLLNNHSKKYAGNVKKSKSARYKHKGKTYN